MTLATRLATTLIAGLLPLAAMAQTDAPATDGPAAPAAPAGDGASVGDAATQEATPSEDATPSASVDPASPETAETPPPPGGRLSTGEAAGQPSEPELYVRETHGDWEVRCLRAGPGQEDPCQLFQRLTDAEGNPTADVNVFDLPADADLAGGATVITPLQTLLTAQLTMSIDGGQPRRYPFAFCDQQGCYARLGFTEEDLAQFRRGATAVLTVVPAVAPDSPAELEMSLAGFTAGMAAVEVDG